MRSFLAISALLVLALTEGLFLHAAVGEPRETCWERERGSVFLQPTGTFPAQNAPLSRQRIVNESGGKSVTAEAERCGSADSLLAILSIHDLRKEFHS